MTLHGCSRKPGILHEIKPRQNPYTQMMGKNKNCARIRTRMADVAIEPLDNRSWKKLLDHEIFRGKEGNIQFRYPRLYFFKLIIHNNTSRPVNLDRVLLKAGDEEFHSLSTSDVKKKCASPAYSVFNFKAMLSQYRVLTDKVCMDKIDLSREIIFTRYQFIPPGDSILRLVAFPWIPVQYREFVVSVELRNAADKKIVDFTMDRLEYRTRGSHFRSPSGEKQP